MIDIHCHILPDFDDGAADLGESLAMARMAVASGVTDIAATSHFAGVPGELRRIAPLVQRYHQLKAALEQEGIPLRLHPGAEILCLPQTEELARKQALPTLGRSNYLLVEFYFDEQGPEMTRMLEGLLRWGYRPVVAHPERYEAVQRDPELLRHWADLGCALQLNKGSLLGAFGSRVRQTAEEALAMGAAHLVASDAHGAGRRTPHMEELRQWLNERCVPEYVQILTVENPARILTGRDILTGGE